QAPRSSGRTGPRRARRALVALARGGGAALLGLLRRGQHPQGRIARLMPGSLLDGPRLAPRSGRPARHLVVFLHGYGADGGDLIEIGRQWAPALPDAAFVSPHAP